MKALVFYARILWSVTVALVSGSLSAAGADHHMHIYSNAGARVWAAMCEAMPGDCNNGEPIPDEALPGEAAVRALDEAGLDKGAILSLAYWYGSPRVDGSEFDDHRRVREENEFVASQVGRYSDRLTGFFSVNPLKDYAVGEVRYWAENGRLAGLKLHLANSGFDFGDQDHMSSLARVIDVMNDHALPVIVHLRHRRSGYGYDQAKIFIDEVARHAPAVTFQLAHMAGWGGYDDGTDGAIQAFLDAIAKGDLRRDRIWFDIAAVVNDELSDDVLLMLRTRVRKIGLDRLLFASDWDEIAPAVYSAMLKEILLLTDDEMDRLMSNEVPYLQ